MPWKRSVDVKEARSIPTKDFGGRSRMRSVVRSCCAMMLPVRWILGYGFGFYSEPKK